MKAFKRALPWPGRTITAMVLVTALSLFGGAAFVISQTNVYQQITRFVEVLNAVKQYYVEDVDTDRLVTGAINGMMETLDPHSVYIPRKQLEKVTEQFEGHFFGIGIEFIIQNKILTVVAPIEGSPSEQVGLRPGDQIIRIEGKSTYGITEEEVMKKLRGPKGTQVTVTIRRPGVEEPFDVTISRDKIPIHSVSTAFMLDPQTGYIGLARFSKTTAQEVEEALQKLEKQGMKRLILDLRLNTGGFLDQAVALADKFLDGGKKIVYTRGRVPNANEEYYSTDEGTHPRYPLIVMIDHGSASASEIVAGALQDWDRALLVGETSFGKGLVQNQIPLKDGSAIRVTIARYYTPSGRLIQRPYGENWAEYYAEGWDELDPNAVPDTIKQKPVFATSAGRKVYGGGGITPDATIREGRLTRFTGQLWGDRLFFEYAAAYAARHRELASDFERFKTQFQVDDATLKDFRAFVERKGVKFNDEEFRKDLGFARTMLASEIARNLWDSSKYYEIRVSRDDMVQEALKLFPQAEKLAQVSMNKKN